MQKFPNKIANKRLKKQKYLLYNNLGEKNGFTRKIKNFSR